MSIRGLIVIRACSDESVTEPQWFPKGRPYRPDAPASDSYADVRRANTLGFPKRRAALVKNAPRRRAGDGTSYPRTAFR
jgi:hypothetical protein